MPGVTRGTIFIPRTHVKLESENGLLRYEYCPSREYTAKRLRETKEILSDFIQMYPIYGHLSQIGNATIVGALWSCFGPPQEILAEFGIEEEREK